MERAFELEVTRVAEPKRVAERARRPRGEREAGVARREAGVARREGFERARISP